jgi:hypothetical protein
LLDQESTYFSDLQLQVSVLWGKTADHFIQNNKRRRNDRGGRDDRDGDAEMTDQKAEEKPEDDPLANATTLYVGNL